MISDDKKLPGTFPGHHYWKAIQGSVDAILAPIGIRRRVVSRGTQFTNYDAWTGTFFTEFLCDELSKHPGRSPTRGELKEILKRTNAVKCRDPHIQVARMPERVNHRVALAIIGGGYHEAWHTKYSKRDRVRMSEVAETVDMIDEVTLAGGKFDAKMRGLLMTLHHLVEDIRIERRGNEEFPGAEQPMRDLQDFVLDLEAKGRAQGAKVKNITVTSNARSILMCALRDLGLGYNTHKAREMLEYYKQVAPGAIAMLAPGGLLAPMLHEATALAADDKMGSLRVAMKIVVALWRATQADGSQEDDHGLACPRCAAGPKDLIVRSVRDEQGRKVRGVAEMECKVCGFKHQFPLPDQSLDFDQTKPEPDEDAERPEIEGLDQGDVDGGDGFGYDARERARDWAREHERQKDSGPPSAHEGDAEGAPEGGPPAPADGASAGTGSSGSQNEDAEEQEDLDAPSQGDEEEFEDLDPLAHSREEGQEEDTGAAEESTSDADGSESPSGSVDDFLSQFERDSGDLGGDSEHDGDLPGSDQENSSRSSSRRPTVRAPQGGEEGDGEDAHWEMSGEELLEKLSEVNAGGINLDLGQDPDGFLQQAEEVLDGQEEDGRVDGIDALEQAFERLAKAEKRDLKRGERIWNPWDPMLDEARIVRSAHKDKDLKIANQMLGEVRGAVTYLRSRLRVIVRAQEMTDTTHGVRRGRKMSSRMLVDTAVDLQSGRMPTRAFQVTDAQADTSFALAMCLDQSGSMWCRVREVAQCMMVMADAVEGIGGQTMAFGFRNGQDGSYSGGWDEKKWHRVSGVRYDVFKTWEEKFVNSKWRFAHTQAAGSTPMADGVQYGLSALNERKEGHRVLAVITDGCPDYPHEQVIARQVRLAREAGIHCIGVGIGEAAQYVEHLFPDHVWAPTVEELPNPLLKKLNELCDFQGRYRGRKARLDGKTTRKVS